MRVDLVGADPGDGLRDELLLRHFDLVLKAGFGGVGAELQAFKGGAVKRGVEGVLVAVPEVGRGAAGVAEGVDVEVAQPIGVPDQFGKCGGSAGVIYVPLLPESCHHEMILDDEEDQFPVVVLVLLICNLILKQIEKTLMLN